MKDLVLLVADKNAHFTLKGALQRPAALGIRNISFEVRVHPGRDGGARTSGPEVLALERTRFSHGLLVLDFEGCGAGVPDALSLENELDSRLQTHWRDCAKSIVIEPEIDVWMWGSDNAIQDAIDWDQPKSIREWLRFRGFLFEPEGSSGKPIRPKEALEEALRLLNQPRSSALYQRIAEKISLRKCTDGAFTRLRRQLIEWFPS